MAVFSDQNVNVNDVKYCKYIKYCKESELSLNFQNVKLKKIRPAYCQFRPDGDGFKVKHLILKKENLSIRSKQNISAYDLNRGSQHMI